MMLSLHLMSDGIKQVPSVILDSACQLGYVLLKFTVELQDYC